MEDRKPLVATGGQPFASARGFDPVPAEPGSEDLFEEEKAANVRPRQCTDVLCVLIFVAGWFGLALTMRYAFEHGDIRKLYHGINYANEICGLDEGLEETPFLYWCTSGGSAMDQGTLTGLGMATTILNSMGQPVDLAGAAAVMMQSTALDTEHPICVSSCPTDAQTFHSCLQTITAEEQEPHDITGDYWKKFTYDFGFVQDHSTFPMAHRFCLPTDSFLLEQLKDTMYTGLNSLMYQVSEIAECWLCFLLSGLLAVALGYAYFFLVDKLAGPVIYTAMVLATFLPLGTGLYFLYGAFAGDIGDQITVHLGMEIEMPVVPTTSNREWDTILGSTLTVLGLLIGVFGWCKKRSIDLVIATVQATVSVMYDVPTLLMQPLVTTLVRCVVLALFLYGFAWILTTGQVEHYELTQYLPKGIARTFSHSDDEMMYIMYYVFLCLWIWEFMLALEQFIVAYTVQLWFFSPYKNGQKSVPMLPIARAYFAGMTYHMGSLAFGGVIMAMFRGVYYVSEFIRRQVVGTSPEDENINAVATGASAACCCCLHCFENLVRYLNKGAYLVVAVDSVGFCAAADKSLGLMTSEVTAMAGLQGATVIFQVLGSIAITFTGPFLTFIIVHNFSPFNDPTSAHFIAQPELVTVVAGVICLAVASAFMTVFDTVSDTLLFAWVLDKNRRKEMNLPVNQNVPPKLQAILNQDLGK